MAAEVAPLEEKKSAVPPKFGLPGKIDCIVRQLMERIVAHNFNSEKLKLVQIVLKEDFTCRYVEVLPVVVSTGRKSIVYYRVFQQLGPISS
ncbi:hypothetical protein LZ30DRAFT_787098 [Colletotrichum cereale]|nr:hypothetical protein LZ30DRAFT_787098 [Colletotrichum cereale]